MKKLQYFLVALALLLAVTACETAPPVEDEAPAADTPTDTQQTPVSDPAEPELFRAINVDPVQYEITWSVAGTTEDYVLELTDGKYQGRSGGSEGNRLAADWIAARFEQLGLQQLPTLGSWKQSYDAVTTSVLGGEALLVAPDGTETALELGVDWAFRASPEALDVTVTLTTDDALLESGQGIWDACEQPKGSGKRLCLTVGEPSDGISYTNPIGNPSRILVTEAVYRQLKQGGCRLHLRLPDAVDESGSADNVVAYLPGGDSTKAVVLGANFDGPGPCGPLLLPGAYNNASGVATLLQTAAWLADAEELPCDVIFAAFNTEDGRSTGSAALADHLESQYEQIRMVDLKCIGWRDQPLTVYGDNADAALRSSLAGGLALQYADYDVGSDERAFSGGSMSSVSLFQSACLSDQSVSSVLNTTRDTAENLDFAMLDDLARCLAAWVIERSGESLTSYVVYW